MLNQRSPTYGPQWGGAILVPGHSIAVGRGVILAQGRRELHIGGGIAAGPGMSLAWGWYRYRAQRDPLAGGIAISLEVAVPQASHRRHHHWEPSMHARSPIYMMSLLAACLYVCPHVWPHSCLHTWVSHLPLPLSPGCQNKKFGESCVRLPKCSIKFWSKMFSLEFCLVSIKSSNI